MQTDIRAAAGIAAPLRTKALETFAAEVAAFQRLVESLDADDWSRPTASAGWSTRDVVAHVAAQCEELARFDRFLRRLRGSRKRYPDRIMLDAHNQFQIDELAGRPTAALTAHLARFGPAAVRAVRRMPGLMRRLPSSVFFPEPPLPDRRMSYLFDVLTSRDVWMHRLDIARATQRPFTVDDHDADVVLPVIRDLGRGWRGPAVAVELTGDVTGVWTLGTGAPAEPVRVDWLGFMLHLSGRGGLELPADSPLLDARVVF
jgi:uncharacterized protein (TIGR03083 family)